MGSMFCPKCNSLNVKREITASLALGAPQKWICNECGYSNYIFPEAQKSQLNKIVKAKKKNG